MTSHDELRIGKKMSKYDLVETDYVKTYITTPKKIRGCTINPELSFEDAVSAASKGKFDQFLWRGKKYDAKTKEEVEIKIQDIIDTWNDVKIIKVTKDG